MIRDFGVLETEGTRVVSTNAIAVSGGWVFVSTDLGAVSVALGVVSGVLDTVRLVIAGLPVRVGIVCQ